MFQASVREGGRLDLCVTMRSVDLFLGLPFDVASYAVLLCLLAKEADLVAGDLTFMMGDAHIYQNHLQAVATVLERQPLPLPKLRLKDQSLFQFHPSHAALDGYKSQGKVLAEMNV
jgi:thymidylate synthase